MNLVRQTSIYFVANVVSAVFGLANVMIFTRLLPPAEYGVYIIGVGFSAVLGTLLYTWLKQAILREEAKGDGTDIRGTILLGFAASALTFPIVYGVAAFVLKMDTAATLAATGMTMAVGFFELGQELARARLNAKQFMVATILRAVLVSIFGVVITALGGGGVALLLSAAAAFLVGAGLSLRNVWRGAAVRLKDPRFTPLFIWGLPLTISISILALSSTLDRFILASLLGSAAAGEYGASVDLVRQALIIPAISASSAFIPMAVRLLANDGVEAARSHLDACFELLLAVVLPSCIGFALVSPYIADLVLGPQFRDTARLVMPAVSIAVIFQVVTNQYLHISFLIANRNMFYMINTVLTLSFNIVAALILTYYFGIAGAVLSRLATEVFATICAAVLSRFAFPMPMPLLRLARVTAATSAMALAVMALDRLGGMGSATKLALLIAGGMAGYAATCWAFDVAHVRARTKSMIAKLRGSVVPAA